MSQAEAMAVFTYGSLMFAPVWQRVTGLTGGPAAIPRPARLSGFSRYAVAGEHYPALLRDSQGVVDGALYEAVPSDIVALLDEFEGSDYQRIQVNALLTDGAKVEPAVFDTSLTWPDANQVRQVQVYLFIADSGPLPQAWSVRAFADTGLSRFMSKHVHIDRR